MGLDSVGGLPGSPRVSEEVMDNRDGLSYYLQAKFDGIKTPFDALRAAMIVADLNGIENPDRVEVGTKIKVPSDLVEQVEANKAAVKSGKLWAQYKAKVGEKAVAKREKLMMAAAPVLRRSQEKFAGTRGVAEVAWPYVNYRGKPTVNGTAALGRFFKGDKVEVYGREGDWLKIKKPGGASDEYVYTTARAYRSATAIPVLRPAKKAAPSVKPSPKPAPTAAASAAAAEDPDAQPEDAIIDMISNIGK